MSNDPLRQHEFLQEIGGFLLDATGDDWLEISLDHCEVDTISVDDLRVTTREGEEQSKELPPGLVETIARLRAEMYREEAGTWFRMVYTITPPGSFSVDYDYDSTPEFPFELDPVTYHNDLQRFPRSSERIPDWLRQALAEAQRVLEERGDN